MALPDAMPNQPHPPEPPVLFDDFFAESEPMLRRALVARFGADLGREAACEALSYGWLNWDRVRVVANPRGYLYRVGERWARRQQERARRPTMFRRETARFESNFEPGLSVALDKLSPQQRQVVALVVGFGYTYQQVADMLGLSRSSIQTHVERAMTSLKKNLGVTEQKGPQA